MEAILALGILTALGVLGWAKLSERGSGRVRIDLPPRRRPLLPPPGKPADANPAVPSLMPPPVPVIPVQSAPLPAPGVAREHEVADDATSAGVAPPTIADWSRLIAPIVVGTDVQLPYVLQWIQEESGGNPCEIGNPAQSGPDGFPREMGIAQFYNPDDLNRLKISSAALRAYCVPGNQHPIRYKGRIVLGFSQALVRPILAAEMLVQAQAAVDLVKSARAAATRDLTGVQAGPGWSPTRRDFWNLVKLQHGLPGISRSGLPAVAKKLGRAPRDWAEFRATLGQVTLDPATEGYRSMFPEILANAEKCGAAFVERGVS